MNEQQWLSLALASMHKGEWYGWRKDWTGEHRMSYENVIVNNPSITKPTLAEVEAKIQELKDAEVAREVKKEEAKAKLIELGLTEEHLKALGI
jgi:hypothetical protein